MKTENEKSYKEVSNLPSLVFQEFKSVKNAKYIYAENLQLSNV